MGNTRLEKRRIRAAWLQEYKAKQECLLCGGTDALEFHHINPYTKRYEIALASTQSERVMQEEIAKCWVLCEECHKKLHLGVLCVLPEYYRAIPRPCL